MTKRKSTSTSSTSTPEQIAHAALLPVFLTYASEVAESGKRTASRSKAICDAIAAMFAAYANDAPGYMRACVNLFGNGIKTKDERVTGTLYDALKAQNVTDGTVYVTLHHAREVALAYVKDDVRKVASEKGLRAAYNTAKPKAKSEGASADTSAEKPSAAWSPSMAIALVNEHFDDVLVALQAYFVRAKDSISLAKLGEIENHLNQKTGTK